MTNVFALMVTLETAKYVKVSMKVSYYSWIIVQIRINRFSSIIGERIMYYVIYLIKEKKKNWITRQGKVGLNKESIYDAHHLQGVNWSS